MRRLGLLLVMAACGGGSGVVAGSADGPLAPLPDALATPDAPAPADAVPSPPDAPVGIVDARPGMGVHLLQPTHAPPRMLVAIAGDFDAFDDVGLVEVELAGGARAKVYSTSTRTQIVFAVPTGAMTGPITVTTPPHSYVSPQPFTVDAVKPCSATVADGCDIVAMDTLTAANIAGAAVLPASAILFPADGRLLRAADADREDWRRDASAGPALGRPAFDGTTLLAPRIGGTDLLRSTDGVDWTPRPIGASAEIGRVYALGAGKFVAFAGPQGFWTDDVFDWHAATVPAATGTIRDVVLAGTRLIAVGSDGAKARVWTSDDEGKTWTDRPSAGTATTSELRGVAAIGTAALAVGAAGATLRSADGATWVNLFSNGKITNADLNGVGATASLFVIAGDGMFALVAKGWSAALTRNLVPAATLRAVDLPFLSGDGGTVYQVLGL